jgi:hypothetical protein
MEGASPGPRKIEPRFGAREGDDRGHEGVRGSWSNLLSFPLVETWWQSTRWRDGQCIGWRTFATKADAVETIDQER